MLAVSVYDDTGRQIDSVTLTRGEPAAPAPAPAAADSGTGLVIGTGAGAAVLVAAGGAAYALQKRRAGEYF
jgi:hypothetical protein